MSSDYLADSLKICWLCTFFSRGSAKPDHRQGIDQGAEEEMPSKLFFMIASPADGAKRLP
ncbi:MAG: hypothetical protein ACRCTP_22900 [Aeromonas popoffii]|jgi:hypothetical protein|uniref:hypothetical protein n=1 Tax=Aeromonas popoffii TaxID=70856 RepID=UPI003F3AA733